MWYFFCVEDKNHTLEQNAVQGAEKRNHPLITQIKQQEKTPNKKNSRSVLNHRVTFNQTHSIQTPSNHITTPKLVHILYMQKQPPQKPTHSSSHAFNVILQSKLKFHSDNLR